MISRPRLVRGYDFGVDLAVALGDVGASGSSTKGSWAGAVFALASFAKLSLRAVLLIDVV